MAIKDWNKQYQPREKLIAYGAKVLSDEELLAIFLRVGVQGSSAIELAEAMLHHFGSIRALMNASKEQFCSLRGLGEAKYVQLKATEELTKRQLNENIQQNCRQVQGSSDVKSLMKLELRDEPREVFKVMFLDTHHRIIKSEILFYGTINMANVYPREILRRIIDLNAAAIILVHNHPSGIAEPSHADINLTNKLKELLSVIDVRILDHLIVGEDEVTSMSELGLL